MRTCRAVRVCIVYDCLFPHTVGGAERWCRALAERLADGGDDVTYLTLRQWPRGEDPGVRGVRVVTAGPRMELYVAGRRRILPPVVFGAGVLWHLLRHGGRYDVVHTASFPYFSLLAAGLARRRHRFRVVVDWHELWTRRYWRDYLGRVGGALGWWVQRLCVRIPHRAFCFSRLHAQRLREEGFRGPVEVLTGEYSGALRRPEPGPAESMVVFAGRHIPEKRVPALIPAIALARRELPELRAVVFGDGPDRPAVARAVAEQGLADAVELPGFVPFEKVDAALRRALCMVLPSRREGYGMIVVEAAAAGVPSIVARDPDSAATELVDEGQNGFVAPSASPQDLAEAILRVHHEGHELRERTADWFERNAPRLSLDESLRRVVASYSAADVRPASAAIS